MAVCSEPDLPARVSRLFWVLVFLHIILRFEVALTGES
jgi:hypothetical protein